MDKKITMTDIAKKLGVSQTLVSFVLSGKNDMGISAETKNKVLDTAEKMGYCSNAAAKMLKLGRSGFAAVVFENNPENHLSDIISCANNVFSKFGYNLTVPGNPAEKADIDECKKLAESRKIDGFLVFGNNDGFIGTLSECNIPVEYINNFEKTAFTDSCKRLCKAMLLCSDEGNVSKSKKASDKRKSSVKKSDKNIVSDDLPKQVPTRQQNESIWLL